MRWEHSLIRGRDWVKTKSEHIASRQAVCTQDRMPSVMYAKFTRFNRRHLHGRLTPGVQHLVRQRYVLERYASTNQYTCKSQYCCSLATPRPFDRGDGSRNLGRCQIRLCSL